MVKSFAGRGEEGGIGRNDNNKCDNRKHQKYNYQELDKTKEHVSVG